MESIGKHFIENYLKTQDDETMLELKQSIDYALYLISNQKNLQISEQLASLTQLNFELSRSIAHAK